MKISDLIRQLNEAKALYGDLPIKAKTPCVQNFRDDVSHRHTSDCYEEAAMQVIEVNFPADNHRMVVID